MPATDVTERRPFELDDGSEEVRVRLGQKDRLEITSEDGGFVITIQADGEGAPEICFLEGHAVIYT
jgi:hypothetical protein